MSLTRRNADKPADPIKAYDHPADRRKNNPPAGLAAQGRIPALPKQRFEYNPHLPPVLRFDQNGGADHLPELLETAGQRPLTGDEVRLLAEALRVQEPWLEWTGKREVKACEVDPVALHIHERISAQAILRVAARQDVQRSLFADPEQDYREAVQFYQHDVEWANRLILGDSLAVMSSLAKREDLAGKVQMIYVDPPYGIRYGSNFMPLADKREVKDKPEDLTREPEAVKAYRDTWTRGVHSYLAYLRDRLYAARELLADSGCIFVQIGEQNVHRVRMVMDEVFGSQNAVVSIILKKKGSTTATDPVNDHILWYAKDKAQLKVRTLLEKRTIPEDDPKFNTLIGPEGDSVRTAQLDEAAISKLIASGYEYARVNYPVVSQDTSTTRSVEFIWRDKHFECGDNAHWRYDPKLDMHRLAGAGRLFDGGGKSVGGVVKWSDWPYVSLSNVWNDLHGEQNPIYVVQTNRRAVERCLLMTTEPGDLVLDPTCGGGTTAWAAEKWGRRWITIDTSRVALALARQRLMTAKFDYYLLRDPQRGVAGGFRYKPTPHITLKGIAKNTALDATFTKWEPMLSERLERLNITLGDVTPKLRGALVHKLELKRRKRDKNDLVTDADERRWKLPATGWNDWEVPFDTDPDWPRQMCEALLDYRKAWRARMDEIEGCIAACAEPKERVNDPDLDKTVLRVSGPFTVEGVMPVEDSLDLESPIGGEPDELEGFGTNGHAGLDPHDEPVNAEGYIERMFRLLKADGVRFPDNKVMQFVDLQPLSGDLLHAQGEWAGEDGQDDRCVGVVFGPQYGPVTAKMVEECLRVAYRRGYDDLVFAGFSFDGAAQAVIQDDANPGVRTHLAHIRPDVLMDGLLKDTPNSQLFTVSGLPRAELKPAADGQFIVEMEGVDIYDPVSNTIRSARADKVAAWFLDSDYDGRTFCICQAFFPDAKAWDKLSKALIGVVDPDRFVAFSGTTSLPFPAGKHNRAAVKVIDPRGNEVMRVLPLEGR
jgi:adenine-specific DNA-methyltransferase